MATMMTRKRKSEEITDVVQSTTPTGSPARKKLKITQSQKQALIDNLQFEVTERARKLRAHYALQSADLRARIERRINRIPISLRHANMGQLFEKHLASQAKSEPAATIAPKQTSARAISPENKRPLPAIPNATGREVSSPARVAAKGRKRKSSEIHIAMDKENDDGKTAAIESLPMPKNAKRTRVAQPQRTTSRSNKPTSVLSPRSHNSRTLPRSPIKADAAPMCASPVKQSFIARPTSPLKPASPLKAAATAASSAISASIHGMVEQAKRGNAAAMNKISRPVSREKPTHATNTTFSPGKMLPPPRPATALRTTSQSSNHSATSDTSASSTNTTVVKKNLKSTATTTTNDTTAAKSGLVGAAKTALKKNAAATNKKVVVAEPAAGRRVLRKRN